MQLHHAELCVLQVCDDNMCCCLPKWMRVTNTNGKNSSTGLAVPVSSHTDMSLPLYVRAVLPSVVCPSVPFLAFQLYRGHRRSLVHVLDKQTEHCNDSHNSVLYGRANWTGITVVSKSPRKELGSHACAKSGYQELLSDFVSSWE